MFKEKKLQARIEELEKKVAETSKENKRLRDATNQLTEKNEALSSDLEAESGSMDSIMICLPKCLSRSLCQMSSCC